ncbi:MAG: MFS transporter [Betaproteobacteria bacterium]
MTAPDYQPRERALLGLLAAIQVTHIMDFMMMMPLGPQLMRVFQVTPHEFGLLVSAYTFGAAASGFLAAFHIDRFDRKIALLGIYSGFVVTTLLCAIAPGFWTLLVARAAAGVFGGIAGAVVYAIIGDLIPEARRGAATGVLSSAFSLAAIAGVPIGLFLANRYTWRAPFAFLTVASLLLWTISARLLPKIDRHLKTRRSVSAAKQLQAVFADRNHLQAFALTATLMFAGFSVIPFISPYMVANVGLAETDLPYLYFAGGLATLFTSRWIGRLSDRHGKRRMFRIVATISMLPLMITTNLPPVPVPLAICASVIFMVFVSGRFVPLMAMVTGSVAPRLRGSFLVFNSSIQQLFAGLAAYSGGLIMGRAADGRITHYWVVGLLAVAATLACIWLSGMVQPASEDTADASRS